MGIENTEAQIQQNKQQVHHHHHHHHHRVDDAEAFKQHQLRAQRMRKLTAKITYYVLVVVAILVILTVGYVYTH